SLDRLSVVILAFLQFPPGMLIGLGTSALQRYGAPLRAAFADHRSEPHSRMEDWLENFPASGVRAVCSWERFCTFAREPERHKVGGDARVSVAGGVRPRPSFYQEVPGRVTLPGLNSLPAARRHIRHMNLLDRAVELERRLV